MTTMTHDAAYRAPRWPRDYHPTIRHVLKAERRAWWIERAIDALGAIAIVGIVFGAIELTQIVERYRIANEQRAALAAEVSELRGRIHDLDSWDCRAFKQAYGNRQHQWCTRKEKK